MVSLAHAECSGGFRRAVGLVPSYEFQGAGHRVVAQQRELVVEEKIEAVYLHSEDAGEYVMAELMHCHKNQQCEDELESFDEYFQFIAV